MAHAAATKPPTTPSWRSIYPVHPCADVFPMMSEAEIDKLAEDITAHGLQQPVVLWQMPKAKPGTGYFVLDGRNRLEALARSGVKIPEPDDPREMVDLLGRRLVCIFEIANDRTWRAPQVEDPAEFVIGANIRRRHLTKEERAELIVKTIDAGAIDCATVARSFNPTSGKKGGSTKDRVLDRAVTEARKHGISKRTVQNARAKLQGKTPAPRKPRNQKRPEISGPAITAAIAAPPSTPPPASPAGDGWTFYGPPEEIIAADKITGALEAAVYDCRLVARLAREAKWDELPQRLQLTWDQFCEERLRQSPAVVAAMIAALELLGEVVPVPAAVTTSRRNAKTA